MKTLILILSLICEIESYSQDLTGYSDSINHFTISLPKGWNYQTSKTSEPGIKLFVARPKEKDSEMFLENFNVNKVSFPNSSLESAYSDLKANISKRSGYVFVSERDTLINGMKYKWHLEKHTNSQTSQPMLAMIVLGYKDGNGYMLTLAATEESYNKYEPLFKRIAGTFSL